MKIRLGDLTVTMVVRLEVPPSLPPTAQVLGLTSDLPFLRGVSIGLLEAPQISCPQKPICRHPYQGADQDLCEHDRLSPQDLPPPHHPAGRPPRQCPGIPPLPRSRVLPQRHPAQAQVAPASPHLPSGVVRVVVEEGEALPTSDISVLDLPPTKELIKKPWRVLSKIFSRTSDPYIRVAVGGAPALPTHTRAGGPL